MKKQGIIEIVIKITVNLHLDFISKDLGSRAKSKKLIFYVIKSDEVRTSGQTKHFLSM